MIYFILLVEAILFFLVFYRLITTNHWTIGKKLLVGLTAGILIEIMSSSSTLPSPKQASHLSKTTFPSPLQV
jgi:hypothetical protein